MSQPGKHIALIPIRSLILDRLAFDIAQRTATSLANTQTELHSLGVTRREQCEIQKGWGFWFVMQMRVHAVRVPTVECKRARSSEKTYKHEYL